VSAIFTAPKPLFVPTPTGSTLPWNLDDRLSPSPNVDPRPSPASPAIDASGDCYSGDHYKSLCFKFIAAHAGTRSPRGLCVQDGWVVDFDTAKARLGLILG